MKKLMKNYQIPSEKTQLEANQIAKAIQKPGQTKEQTKLIAQGIEKGIALYKKQQKEKSRQADKAKKRLSTAHKGPIRQQPTMTETAESVTTASPRRFISVIPWAALIISWLLFTIHWFSHHIN
jgi:hypothetical protein